MKTPAASSSYTILLADDDEAISSAYQYFLEQEGYTVIPAYDGNEALAKIQKHKPDLVLLDLIMPMKNGFEVLEALNKKKLLAIVPVIVISNLGQEREVERCMELGARSYLIKADLSMSAVLRRVRQYLPAETKTTPVPLKRKAAGAGQRAKR
jgi:DNA-binding response OmpR family regulator